ncbi:response regulator [Pontibacter liquoris]|uniref:response regulator n=1 Tax=Pontibacter liquoris TaxID=2905677 RepID=UPI001FA7F7FF|nr:response regulator [Pontibacter liquoris]
MNIFLIDDDDLSRFLTQHTLLLEEAQLHIETFPSAMEALGALKAAGNEVPDIILLDLNMPVMDGWQLLEALGPLMPRLLDRCRIYILTSSLDLADSERAKAYALVSGLIHKPLKSEDIEVIFSQYPTPGKGNPEKKK